MSITKLRCDIANVIFTLVIASVNFCFVLRASCGDELVSGSSPWSVRKPGTLLSYLEDEAARGRDEKEDEDNNPFPEGYRPMLSECPKTLFVWNSNEKPEGGPPGLDDKLASDRPDFTEASCTVGRGRVQLEMGYTYFHDVVNGDSMSEHSFPEMLWRIGMLAEWFELRIAYNHAGRVQKQAGVPGQVSEYGSEDLYVGAKLGLTPQQGFLPEMALMPQMIVPSGDPSFTSGRVLPGLNWLYGWELNEFLSLAGSTQWNIGLDQDEPYFEVAQSVTIGYTFTEKLGGYTEWFGIMPNGATTVLPEYYFDGGFTYSITNDLQYDIRAGVGLNDTAADYFIGTGFVRRW